MKIRIRYRFTGYVQGVGFRFRAYHAARLLGLTGWVRNEPDGSVTVEVQGERREIDAMLEMTERGHYISIDHMDSKKLPPDPDEYSFEIKDKKTAYRSRCCLRNNPCMQLRQFPELPFAAIPCYGGGAVYSSSAFGGEGIKTNFASYPAMR